MSSIFDASTTDQATYSLMQALTNVLEETAQGTEGKITLTSGWPVLELDGIKMVLKGEVAELKLCVDFKGAVNGWYVYKYEADWLGRWGMGEFIAAFPDRYPDETEIPIPAGMVSYVREQLWK